MADRAQRRDGRSARGGEWERSFPNDAAAQDAAVDLQEGSEHASAGAVVGREPAPAAAAVVDRDSSGQPGDSAGQPADSFGQSEDGFGQSEDGAARPEHSSGEGEPTAEPYMVGNSPALRRVFSILRCFARSDAPVLIAGESGTGKELAALALHERSAFGAGPFVAINCAGLPAELIGSELFGHEKGAFTGAHQRRIGRVEAADGGTLFLDEIGDLPPDLQPHLLRFLQEGTIDRIGGSAPIRLKLRVVAATNKKLAAEVARGRFREDLYYRLNVLALELPPLRQRGTDIDLLAAFFLRKLGREMGREGLKFGPDAAEALTLHGWPGNVRELISCIRRAVVMAESDVVTPEDLGLHPVPHADGGLAALGAGVAGAEGAEPPLPTLSTPALPTPTLPTLEAARESAERQAVAAALARYAGNLTQAAAALAVSRVTLYRLLDKHRLRSGMVAGREGAPQSGHSGTGPNGNGPNGNGARYDEEWRG